MIEQASPLQRTKKAQRIAGQRMLSLCQAPIERHRGWPGFSGWRPGVAFFSDFAGMAHGLVGVPSHFTNR
jgi:hypothetical protein